MAGRENQGGEGVRESSFIYAKQFPLISKVICVFVDCLVVDLPQQVRVSDAIQPSHPLSSPSPPAFSISQHQGLFKWVSSSHQVPKVLELQLQSFQWISRVEFLEEWLVWSACSPTDSQESSPTPQFKRTNSSAFSLLYSSTFTCIPGYWKTHSFDHTDFCQQSDVFAF